MLNVALTSRALYDLSQSFIYWTVSFTFNRNRRGINGRLVRRLLTDKVLSAKVREVEILWAPNAKLQPGEGSKEDIELLGKALPNFTRLRILVWDAQYPILSCLLDPLQSHHPECRLYTRHPAHQHAAKTLSRLQLRGSPCLYSLDVKIVAEQYQACRELANVLRSSSITDLAMDNPFGCPSESEKQPIPSPLQLRSLELYGCIDNTWRPATPWSMLERLAMDSISWLPEVASQLTNLKSLHLNIDSHATKHFLTSFLHSCQRLEVLDLTGFTRSLWTGGKSLWRHLGRTLVKLRLCEGRIFTPCGPIFELGELEMIASECPKLRSLGLNI